MTSHRAIPQRSPSSSSSSSSTSNAQENVLSYPDRLAIVHTKMMSVPQELYPASDSLPPSEARVAQLRQQIIDAVSVADGDPSSPKWGHVSRLVKLGCTSRRYVGVAAGVRIGAVQRTEPLEEFEFVLPDTEEEWWACEKRWASWKKKSAPSATDAQGIASKYWLGAGNKPVLSGPKAEFVREKVANWQLTVVGGEVAPLSPVLEEPSIQAAAKSKDKGQGKERVIEDAKSQTSLGFSVVKRAGTFTSKSSQGSHSGSGPHITPIIVKPSPLVLVDVHMESPTPESGGSIPIASSAPSVHAQIADVPEMSFLPPSFPSQLPTSTPVPANPGAVRRKPSPIGPRPSISLLSSSPLSSKSQQLPARPRHLYAEPIAVSSSQPASSLSSPTKRLQKRTRSHTPPHLGKSALSTYGLAYMTSPKKKPRVEQGSTSSALPPPSTPPALRNSQTDEPTTPPAPFSTSKSLGNAKGLPVPMTPERQALPTLTELLASSRRSKPRPRPPSRKLKSATSTPNKGKPKDTDIEATELPAPFDDDDDDDGVSRTKSYFSSPASSSSDSPGSLRQRPRSPVSPLFSQHPDAFAPPYASTQPPGAGAFLGVGSFGSGPGALLARGNSGFFGMGYNSQFDVERHVDRVSELLERDVDYDGWLRDLPDVEAEPSHGGPLTQSQSQGEVVV